MVKPSKGCGACRLRKIKVYLPIHRCDQIRPIFTQCKKSGWDCGGYREKEWVFRDERERTVKKWADTNASGRTLYPGLIEQGVAFFMSNYVMGTNCTRMGQGGFHEYLPVLYARDSERKTLSTIMQAVGLASLANTAKNPTAMKAADALYLQGVQKVREALADPREVKEDQTLAAVMMLGIFEAVTCKGKESMKSLSQHVRGITSLINLRGPEQFRTEEALRLFLQVRRLIIITYSQMGESMPFELRQWSEWTAKYQRPDEIPTNGFAELAGEFVNLRAYLKTHPELKPSVKIKMLLEVDEKLTNWTHDLPEYMRYRTIPVSPTSNEITWGCEHVYSDLWIASIWNSLRQVRLQLQQDVISLSAADDDISITTRRAHISRSQQVQQKLTLEVCQSVAYHLATLSVADRDNAVEAIPQSAGPGGYTLVWPFFLAGMLETTGKEQRLWMAEQLKKIRVVSGNDQAIALAQALMAAKESENFVGSELWTYANEDDETRMLIEWWDGIESME